MFSEQVSRPFRAYVEDGNSSVGGGEGWLQVAVPDFLPQGLFVVAHSHRCSGYFFEG